MLEYKLSDNKHNRNLQLNIKNLCIYSVLYILNLCTFLYVCSYLHLYILIFMTAMPVVSIYMLHRLINKTSFAISISDRRIHKEDVAHIGLLLDNRSIASTLDVQYNLTVGNSFYDTKAPLKVCGAAVMKTVNKLIVPYTATLTGIMDVYIDTIRIKDLTGIVSYTYKVDKSVEIDVFPKNMHSDDIDKTSLYEGVTENEETNSKGNDLSDVSNIREYIPGDRIKDIHWKLSAKKENLMVKERVRVSERQLIMLLDTSGDAMQIDSVLQYAYNVVKMCLTDGIPTRLVWWNNGTKELEDSQIMSFEDLKKAYVDVYRCGICSDIKEACDRMKYMYTNVASYIHILCEEGEVKGVPVENE